MSDLVPRKTLVKQGGQAIGGVVGGIALLILTGIHGIPALIVGGIIAAIGLSISGSRDDRTAGLITTAAGVLTAVAAVPFLGGIAGTLLSISGIGLLIMGGINLFKFIRGYRKRM
jgi:hypothetical protein